ncbi:FAD/NAD(P)-binding protein [Anaerobaca lacustris]|uniref:FAD/NAD(P)-binding protein n=1 Tax=Anaerobaca lacustris TaxID=3044600 RepID=A0AAW6U3W3_9BACT|nr:FAD/NAD(P)-binding protein [Sedimentisphaerales bacterium M17dextr]
MRRNLYQPMSAEIVEIIDESPTIKSFVVAPERAFHFDTGQFVELTLPGEGEAPFTPSSSPAVTERMEITIMKAGRVTTLLHACHKGQPVGIRGPYGSGYPVDEFAGKHVYIVGGGVGLAPIRSLFLTLVDRIEDFKSVVCRFGARTPEDFIYKKTLFGEWAKLDGVDIKLTVDKAEGGWNGHVGVVTKILDPRDVDIASAVAVVCGPPIMMKYAVVSLLGFGFEPHAIYLSMEKNMSCGVGKCGHCMLGEYYVCKDGPVFTYDRVSKYPDIWD